MVFSCCFNPKVKPNEPNKKEQYCLVLLGVDNAGKTTLLSAIKGEPQEHITPTWGFNSDQVTIGGRKLTMYDLGGGKRIRGIWERYYAEVHGAVFVVDSADESKLDDVREVLKHSAGDTRMTGKPFLVLANKQDAPGAKAPQELATLLGFSGLVKDHLLQIKPCTAKVPSGGKMDDRIVEGFTWLLRTIASQWGPLHEKVVRETAEEKSAEEQRRAERKARVEAEKKEREKREAEAGTLAAEGNGGEAPDRPSEQGSGREGKEGVVVPQGIPVATRPTSAEREKAGKAEAGKPSAAKDMGLEDATVVLEDTRSHSGDHASTAAVHLHDRPGHSPLKTADAWGSPKGGDRSGGGAGGEGRKLSFGDRPPPFVPSAAGEGGFLGAGGLERGPDGSTLDESAIGPPGAIPSPDGKASGHRVGDSRDGRFNDTTLNDISVVDPGHAPGSGARSPGAALNLQRGMNGLNLGAGSAKFSGNGQVQGEAIAVPPGGVADC